LHHPHAGHCDHHGHLLVLPSDAERRDDVRHNPVL
jgi:hypothetical protein